MNSFRLLVVRNFSVIIRGANPSFNQNILSRVREYQCSFSFLKLIVIHFLIYFQVFGLGNKTYEHYNKVAVYVDKRLEELGATRVFELGLGDDDAK